MRQLKVFPSWMIAAIVLLAATAMGQNSFSSGSTGADGSFSPTQSQNIVAPDSGVLNFTTVNIPTGVTITYLRNSKNTTLTILATGDVMIAGKISVDGQPGSSVGFGGFGGPGGFSGGNAGVDSTGGSIGDGPGAGRGGPFNPASSGGCGGGGGGSYQSQGANGITGFTSCGTNSSIAGGSSGPKYGTKSLVPLVGGSGGGGGCGFSQADGAGGGGGGGALVIASSTTIALNSGVVSARGGNGGGIAQCGLGSGGGGGSGGAIRLIANTITGSGQIIILGGGAGSIAGAAGGFGFARLEAFNVSGFTLQNTAPISAGLPTSVSPANVPILQIASVGGVNAPTAPVGSFQGAPDVVLPANQPNPVTVVVNGFNIPAGTTVNVTATAASGSSASGSATLSGTTASSSGSASLTLSAGFSVVTATTVVDLAQTGDLKPLFIDGERVEKVEVAANFGGSSSLTYITHSGRRVSSQAFR